MLFILNLPPKTEHCLNSKKSLSRSINYCLWAPDIHYSVRKRPSWTPHWATCKQSTSSYWVFFSHSSSLPPPHDLQRLEFVDCLVFPKVCNIAQLSGKGNCFLCKEKFRKKSTQLCPSHLTSFLRKPTAVQLPRCTYPKSRNVNRR